VRHRHREVSRIEGFSDAVFAFAITLLVVSLEVPKTFDELMLAVRGFPAFAVSFALLFQVWWRHYKFFRHYGLEDARTIALTGVLLFVVLFYVYPLKFIWTVVFSQFRGGPIEDEVLRVEQAPMLFVVYGVGMAAVFVILAALYAHAYSRRVLLELTPSEVVETRFEIYGNVALAGIALASVVVALVTARVAPRAVGIAGFVYFGIGLIEWALGTYRGRAVRRVESAG
jgi:uncharacterized membrane protein